MTDRELLEFAAKAAGFGDPEKGRTCWTESEYPRGSGQKGALWNYVGYMDTAELWNPLTDDGDALRLAMTLAMSVDIEDGEEKTTWAYAGPSPRVYAAEMWKGDREAATRRAIVRAAAEIGKALP